MNKAVCWILGILTGMVVTVGGEAIAVAAIPTKTYLNATGTVVVGENIGNRGLADVITHINQFAISDVPVVKDLLDNLLKSGSFGDFISLEYDDIKDIKLTDPQLAEKIRNAIKITASLKSLKVDLGDFGKLEMFKTWQSVTPTAEEIAKHPTLYYFQDASGKYLRAYDDKGNPANGFTPGTQLYYGNLSEIVVTDLFTHLAVRVPQLTYRNFVETFIGTPKEDDPLIRNIGDMALKDLSTLDTGKFHLKDFIKDGPGTPKLFDLLCDLTGKASADEIILDDLSTINVDDIHLVSVLDDVPENAKTYLLLRDLTGKAKNEDITLADLSSINTNSIHIINVLEKTTANAKVYELLRDLTGKANDEDIVLGDLASVDIKEVHLHTFIDDNASNAKLYTLLRDLTGKPDNASLLLKDLDNLHISDAHLISLLDYTGNEELYDVLADMCSVANPEELTIGSLESGDLNKIHLKTLLGGTSTDNTILKKLLEDDTVIIGNLGTKIDALSIHDLFGANCFTTDSTKKANNDTYYLDTTTNVYTYSTTPLSGDTYYVSKEAGIWLLLAFDASELSSVNGRAGKFSPSTATFSTLQNDPATFSDGISNSTIYQLISAGIIDDDPSYSDNLKKAKLSEVIEAAKIILS